MHIWKLNTRQEIESGKRTDFGIGDLLNEIKTSPFYSKLITNKPKARKKHPNTRSQFLPTKGRFTIQKKEWLRIDKE